VLLCPQDIDSQLRMLIQVPAWAQKVSYIKGSALNDGDLERAKWVWYIFMPGIFMGNFISLLISLPSCCLSRISFSEGVFILSDRNSSDKEGAVSIIYKSYIFYWCEFSMKLTLLRCDTQASFSFTPGSPYYTAYLGYSRLRSTGSTLCSDIASWEQISRQFCWWVVLWFNRFNSIPTRGRIQVYVPQNTMVPQNTSLIYFLYKIWRKYAINFIFVIIY
jgi:hypothetical protein